jgi:hypothetical protein
MMVGADAIANVARSPLGVWLAVVRSGHGRLE